MDGEQPTVDYGPALSTVKAEKLKRIAGPELPAPRTARIGSWPPKYERVLAWRLNQLARFELKPDLVKSARTYYKHHPVEFINHWCDTYDPRNLLMGKPVRFPLVMFKKQEELVEFVRACLDGEASGLVEKARDMGVSWICICLTVWLWLFWPGSAVGWGSRKQEQVDRIGDPSSLFEKIRMLIGWMPDVFKPKGLKERDHLFYQRCINPETGATIIGEIGDNIGRGARTTIYFVDEAAFLEHPEAVEASLSETTRIRVDISSVSGLGTVFYRKREAGQEWKAGQPVVKTATNVFIMDWSDHPEKDQAWHDHRKAKFEAEGMLHVFARETDRDYAAAVEGIIIPAEYVRAAIDAHVKLGLPVPTKRHTGGQDVADGGGDRNALAIRQAYLLNSLDEQSSRDVGVTTRKAVGIASGFLPIDLMYDAIGVGAGVKAEANRLKDDDLLPKGIVFVPWFGSGAILNPFGRVVQGVDAQSPLNRDFYGNLKAQAWWELRLRFERTWRAVNDSTFKYEPDDLISLPSGLPSLRTLQKELSQATMGHTSSMKLIVNKAPEGTKSPNLADAVVMAYWPLPQAGISMHIGAPVVLSQRDGRFMPTPSRDDTGTGRE